MPRFGDMECLHATFTRHCYAPHTHDTYAFGVVERGVELYRSRGCENALTAGRATVINPGDVHDGRPAPGGYEYRMFYPPVSLMQDAAEQLGDRPTAAPSFRNSLMDDPALVASVARLHRLTEEGGHALETESLMLETLACLIHRYADRAPNALSVGDEDAAVRRVKDYVESHLDRDFGLEELAGLVGFSRYRLIRSFRKETGQTPHNFILSRRVERAKSMLRQNAPLSESALACGFFDQSHMNRIFKRAVGVTPGQYRQAVLDA